MCSGLLPLTVSDLEALPPPNRDERASAAKKQREAREREKKKRQRETWKPKKLDRGSRYEEAKAKAEGRKAAKAGGKPRDGAKAPRQEGQGPAPPGDGWAPVLTGGGAAVVLAQVGASATSLWRTPSAEASLCAVTAAVSAAVLKDWLAPAHGYPQARRLVTAAALGSAGAIVPVAASLEPGTNSHTAAGALLAAAAAVGAGEVALLAMDVGGPHAPRLAAVAGAAAQIPAGAGVWGVAAADGGAVPWPWACGAGVLCALSAAAVWAAPARQGAARAKRG